MWPRNKVGGPAIQPINLTRFWHRRICEATMFVSFAVIVLYVLPYVMIPGVLSEFLLVSWQGLILAALTLVVAFVSYLWTPKAHLSLYSFIVYAMLSATTASLILSTGKIGSPFVALWIALAVFSGVFAMRGFLLFFGSVFVYILYGYVTQEPVANLIVAGVAGFAPLVASFIIWHTKSTKDEKHDKAYAQLANELSHEAHKADTVINAINDGVVSIDKQGVIQLINPAAQRMIGWGQSDAVGLSYKSVIKLLDRSDKPLTVSNDPVEKVLASNQEVHSEDFSVQTEAGKKLLLSIVVSPIGTPSTGAIMVFRDMTKEKAEEREQAEFISTASHEMRTPVASIEGYLGLALNPATAQIDEKARDYIQKAQEAAKHLGRLFQDLLDVSRAEDGRLSNNPGVVDVVDFIGDVAEGLRPKAVEKGLHFLYKPKPDNQAQNDRLVAPVFYANVDNDHLREVTANLIENAIKYTLQGDVIVDVDGDDTHVRISIQDSGIGIPAEDIPHLFQKFYRVDNSDTREIGGTGLGLYLCRRLAEVMGGQISVQSEYKKGSTFTLEVPRIDHQEAERLMEAATVADTMMDEPVATIAPEPIVEPQAPLQTESVPAVSMQPTGIPGVYQSQPAAAPVQAAVAQPAPQPIAPAQPTAPVQMPIPQPNPVATPEPIPPQPLSAPAQQPFTPGPQNIPLSQIESNPTAYTARSGVQIPVRGPEESNQP